MKTNHFILQISLLCLDLSIIKTSKNSKLQEITRKLHSDFKQMLLVRCGKKTEEITASS